MKLALVLTTFAVLTAAAPIGYSSVEDRNLEARGGEDPPPCTLHPPILCSKRNIVLAEETEKRDAIRTDE